MIQSKQNLWFILFCILCTTELFCCRDKAKTNDLTQNQFSVIQPELVNKKITESVYSILEPVKQINISLPYRAQLISPLPEEGKLFKKGEILFKFQDKEVEWQLEKIDNLLQDLKNEKNRAKKALVIAENNAKKYLIALENQKLSIAIKKKQRDEMIHRKNQSMELVQIGGLPASENRTLEKQIEIIDIELNMAQNNYQSALIGISANELFPNQQNVSTNKLQEKQIFKLTEEERDSITKIENQEVQLEKEKKQFLARKEELTIRAPETSFIHQIKINQWEWSQSNQPIAILTVQSKLRAELASNKNYKKYLPIGGRLPTVLMNGNPKIKEPIREGIIKTHHAILNPTTGQFSFEIEIDNKDYELFPGDYIKSEILLAETKCWQVPLTAILEKNQKKEIILINKNKAVCFPIEGELSNQTGFLITNPPPQIYPILNYPNLQITNGMQININKEVAYVLSKQ